MESRLEVNPEDIVTLIFLCRQDICDKVVPVQEPAAPEDVQDLKDRGTVVRSCRGDYSGGLSRLWGGGGLPCLSAREGGRGEGRGVQNLTDLFSRCQNRHDGGMSP